MREEAVIFGTHGALVGIITDPPAPAPAPQSPAVLLLNSGVVHRVGPNRLYVKLARSLAALGCVVGRFDFASIGDSSVRSDALPFAQSAVLETQEAMAYLRKARGCERFILMGICSGANASFQTARRDTRVVGAVLINPVWHLHDTHAADHAPIRHRTMMRHYRRLAFSRGLGSKNWRKALTGAVDYQGLRRAMLSFPITSLLTRQWRQAEKLQQGRADLQTLGQRGVRLLHICSEGDFALDYLHVVLGKETFRRLFASQELGVEVVRGVNHTFTPRWGQQHLLHLVRQWIRTGWPHSPA